MPILNGIDASKQLNESGYAAKIIFLIVHDNADLVQTWPATGAFGYVAKTRFAIDRMPAIHEQGTSLFLEPAPI
jgi:DNA-binding NarL/FixJ family response regulator